MTPSVPPTVLYCGHTLLSQSKLQMTRTLFRTVSKIPVLSFFTFQYSELLPTNPLEPKHLRALLSAQPLSADATIASAKRLPCFHHRCRLIRTSCIHEALACWWRTELIARARTTTCIVRKWPGKICCTRLYWSTLTSQTTQMFNHAHPTSSMTGIGGLKLRHRSRPHHLHCGFGVVASISHVCCHLKVGVLSARSRLVAYTSNVVMVRACSIVIACMLCLLGYSLEFVSRYPPPKVCQGTQSTTDIFIHVRSKLWRSEW